MTPGDDRWWDAQCGEYVLGTLRGNEREIFEKILSSDKDVRIRVEYWEKLLKGMDVYIETIQPPSHVLQNILHKIRAKQAPIQDDDSSSTEEPHDLTSEWTRDLDQTLDAHASYTSTQVADSPETLRQNQTPPTRRSLWKIMSLLATTATLVLAGLLTKLFFDQGDQQFIPQNGFLSIVQNNEQQALWLVLIDKYSANSSIRANVTALSPPPTDASSSYQLWLVLANDSGIESVGLLPESTGQSHYLPLPKTVKGTEAFIVSLEPAAGSSQTVPSGPVLFNGIIQTLGESD
ncbi:MAG: anti-sigma factor [Granulosicoccus sp.]